MSRTTVTARQGAVSAPAEGRVEHVVHCLAAYGIAGTLLEFPTEPLAGPEWDLLLERCREQRITGMLDAAVTSGALPSTDAQAGAAMSAHLQMTCVVLLLEAELLELTENLRLTGLDFRVLKGSAAAHLDYPEPSLRSFGDVDILVRGEEFDEVTALLSGSGYRRRYPEPRPGFDRRFSKGTSFITPKGVSLDLHRTFVMGPFGLRIQLDDLWGEAATFAIGSAELPALDMETRFLHACYHTSLGDVVPRLVPQRDVAQMVLSDRLDYQRLRELMQRWSAEPVVAKAVATAWESLQIADATALSAWAARYRPSPLARRELGIYADEHSGYAEKSVAALRALPRWRDRAAFVHALAFPQASYLVGRAHGTDRIRKARAALARSRAAR